MFDSTYERLGKKREKRPLSSAHFSLSQYTPRSYDPLFDPTYHRSNGHLQVLFLRLSASMN